MLPRERVFAALEFQPPDVVPLEYHPSPAGTYEHGRKLLELFARYPGDFGDPREFVLAAPEPRWVDAHGRYEELRRDEWGVLWKHLIFGVAGHPVERPLDDWSRLASFQPPPPPRIEGEAFAAERQRAERHRRTWFLKSGWISLFERMHALRRFEDVFLDLAAERPELEALADLLERHEAACIDYYLQRGVDAIQFGDDFGTQTGMMLSPRIWRRFFKPRYRRLMEPVHAAGRKVFFHTCGQARAIWEDLAELGVHALWPQLSLYDAGTLARECRRLRMALALHVDRGDLMTKGAPEEVRAAVLRAAEDFRVAEGGAWFYVEIDSGFPFANVEALVETISELRNI